MIQTMSNTVDPPMELNLAHLRTLQAVVSHGSFSRAAERLHLSQPAVSLHIRQLEERAGLPLLEHVGKRAFATTAGEILLEHAGAPWASSRGDDRSRPPSWRAIRSSSTSAAGRSAA